MFSRSRVTTRDIRADQVRPGMVVTTYGPITVRRGGETITHVQPGTEHGQPVIYLTGSHPRWAWVLPPDTTVRVIAD